MKKLILGISTLILLSACNNSGNNNNTQKEEEKQSTQKEKIENLLNTPEQIILSGTTYDLAWSSHPSGNYYKQEFLPKGEELEKYKKMIMVELVTGDFTPEEVMAQKIQELEARKMIDQMAKYKVSENKEKGELLLDFMLSDSDGKQATTTEWNAYRYTTYEDASGKKGVCLFALSKREYGRAMIDFVKDLETNRLKYVAEFTELNTPKITLK